ncbi:MAG: DUF975 family protein [Kiritimatiellales bacterium]|jgi:uncharacterized membrane protein
MKSSTPVRDLTVTAREGLDGNWGKSIGVMAAYLILLVGVRLVPFAGRLLELIFAAPLTVGMTVYLLATVRKQSNPFSLLFSGFDRFGTSLCTYLLIMLIMLIWMIPFGVVTAVLFFAFHVTSPLIWALLILTMIAVMIPIQMRYSLALYVVADDPSVRARQAVRRGIELMKGNYGRLGMLWLRFVGWQLFGILTLGISFIWLAPYFMASITVFYDDLTTNG